jgi:FAD/FMN-containing dehydrogenase
MKETSIRDFRKALERDFPSERLLFGDEIPTDYHEDYTEEEPRPPSVVVKPETTEEVQRVVRAASDTLVPLTVRVTGSNVGGLTIPPKDGAVVDLSLMSRILEIQDTDMYAVIQPGVTWEQLKARLEDEGLDLRLGYPLSPPDTSVMANCLLDGLGNLSLPFGSMGDWIGGMEVVLPTGRVAQIGAPALSDVWFGRGPIPSMLDLFVNWQSATGIVTRMALQLWPKPPLRRRLFILCYDRHGAFSAMRRLARLGVLDDLGGLSWTTGRMLFGVEKPLPAEGDEPEFFLYLEITGHDSHEIDVKLELVETVLSRLRGQGLEFEPPFALQTLVSLNPEFGKFADFPTRLEFLVDSPGGGLTWVGTYGPMSRFEPFADRALAILERYGVPPTIVSRPMKGGHFGVLRFITLFDKSSAEERESVRKMNVELASAAFDLGFLVYKAPPWAVDLARPKLDAGYVELFNTIRSTLDPRGIMAPHCWSLSDDSHAASVQSEAGQTERDGGS